jgi:hypothetical protein
MNRRKERTEVVAAYIKGGAIPRADEVADMLGVSKATALRTIVLALDYLAHGCKHEAPFDSSKKMIPRRRILCNGITLAGGFATLTIRYGTMWGAAYGYVELTIPVAGEFQKGRLPFDTATRIAERVVDLCREKWGEFICDLTTARVIEDMHREELAWETPSECNRAMAAWQAEDEKKLEKLKNLKINDYES